MRPNQPRDVSSSVSFHLFVRFVQIPNILQRVPGHLPPDYSVRREKLAATPAATSQVIGSRRTGSKWLQPLAPGVNIKEVDSLQRPLRCIEMHIPGICPHAEIVSLQESQHMIGSVGEGYGCLSAMPLKIVGSRVLFGPSTIHLNCLKLFPYAGIVSWDCSTEIHTGRFEAQSRTAARASWCCSPAMTA